MYPYLSKLHGKSALALFHAGVTGMRMGNYISDHDAYIAKKLAIRPAFVFAEQTAELKKQMIQQQNPCLYVGDGLNDVPALSEAFVSFAIKGTFESTLQVSDIYAPLMAKLTKASRSAATSFKPSPT